MVFKLGFLSVGLQRFVGRLCMQSLDRWIVMTKGQNKTLYKVYPRQCCVDTGTEVPSSPVSRERWLGKFSIDVSASNSEIGPISKTGIESKVEVEVFKGSVGLEKYFTYSYVN